jgi:PadR family transcriptional regulator, regulatory protein AphA
MAQDSQRKLTPTSYIVLGLIEMCGEATPYDLKGIVAASLGNFWSVQHAQLYTETARLAQEGLLSERREEEGRRRKLYALTQAGSEALRGWTAEPTRELYELRDIGLLKLFFGADPAAIAPEQLEAHRAKLAEYEGLIGEADALTPKGPRLALESGIEHERVYVRFWERLAKEG